MKRDLPRLASAEFDVLVIGGGIYGLATAYEAAQRGLSVALIERGDFGSATSFNHLKTIHGGLRYLQTGDLTRMRESIRERRAFARIAPRFVAPLAFVMPTSGSFTRNVWAMRAALAIDAVVGSDRNAGLPLSHHLPAGRIVSPGDYRELFDAEIPRPGAMWFDYETVHGDRLTLAFALAADSHGAALANYVEAVGMVSGSGRISSVHARDILRGDAFEIRARLVVNATGPWSSGVMAFANIGRAWPMLKAMNLVTTRPARKAARVAPSPSGRALIMLPWQGRTLIGTSESGNVRGAEDQQIQKEEIASFVSEVNATFPELHLHADEITLVHRGIVPAENRGGRLGLLGHSILIDHAADGVGNFLSVVGVKYTTARAVAERAVDVILKKLKRPYEPSRTADTILPTASPHDPQPENPISHAIEAEMAHTLADVVIRRTGLGAGGYPGDAIVAETAGAMQQLCGWPADRVASEVAALKRFYVPTSR